MNTVCRCLTLCCEQKQGTCIKHSARLIDWLNFWSHGDLEGCRSTDKLSWAIFILLNTHLLSPYTCVLTSICIISKSFWNVQTRTLAATNSNPLTQRLMSSDSQKLEVSCPVVSYLPDVLINVWWLLFVFRFLDSFTLYSWQVWNSLSSWLWIHRCHLCLCLLSSGTKGVHRWPSHQCMSVLKDAFIFLLCEWVFVHALCVYSVCRGQKKALDPPELVLQMVGNHMWVPGTNKGTLTWTP